MCGILGLVSNNVVPILLEGLKHLEYRGYDSSGLAVYSDKIYVEKKLGLFEENPFDFSASVGLAHTRWATHGKVSINNAHPHVDCNNKVALVHNGVIENWKELKQMLSNHKFKSQTDSEVVAHLIEENLDKGHFKAFEEAISKLNGSYAIVAMIEGFEGLFFAKMHSPLLLIPEKHAVVSDASAIVANKIIPLENGDYGYLDKNGFAIFSKGKPVLRNSISFLFKPKEVISNYPHYMLKEIHDQVSLFDSLPNLPDLDEIEGQVDIIGAGSSYHAAKYLELLLNSQGIRARSFLASEYKYSSDTLVSFTQSGETADVLRVLERFESKKITITNTLHSTAARLSDIVIPLNAGVEKSVAATKTFLAQLIVSAKWCGYEVEKLKPLVKELVNMDVRDISEYLFNRTSVFYVGRGYSYPIAMEGSLKLKEISYIFSEAYAGGELKHGTLSLIEKGVPVVALNPNDSTYSKMWGNIEEISSRGGEIIHITDGDSDFKLNLKIPSTEEPLYPILEVIPLQLIAYNVAVKKGHNPDKPRNLAKAVTVE